MAPKKTVDSTVKQAEIAERRRVVASMLAKRMPQVQIAKALKVSQWTISNDIKEIKKAWLEAAKADIADIAARELAELEDMEDDAAQAQSDPVWFEKRLKVKERKAKMLGLDAATKSEIAGKNGGPIEFADTRSALAARLTALLTAGEGS